MDRTEGLPFFSFTVQRTRSDDNAAGPVPHDIVRTATRLFCPRRRGQRLRVPGPLMTRWRFRSPVCSRSAFSANRCAGAVTCGARKRKRDPRPVTGTIVAQRVNAETRARGHAVRAYRGRTRARAQVSSDRPHRAYAPRHRQSDSGARARPRPATVGLP